MHEICSFCSTEPCDLPDGDGVRALCRIVDPSHTHRLLSHVMRMGKGVMTFIERTPLFESASWHFKSHQDQLFCSVLAVERVLTRRQWEGGGGYSA